MGWLRVSDNRRYLVRADGRPFFFLADTAWELFHRLDEDETRTYLEDRATKGFTVIQAVALAEFDGLRTPNAYGHLPLDDLDPTKPNEGYFQDVDRTVRQANELGLTIGLLPTWGDKVNKKWGQGPEIFNPTNARWYGEWLGRRYRDAQIIWINGGDRPIENDHHRATFTALAEGLRAGDGGEHLITFHPMGGHGSAEWFHGDAWLDFNMRQSGHGRRDADNWRQIAGDLARQPAKPAVDGEPCYENHPINWKPENGWFDEWDVRKTAYWAVFAGACGTTYGCHDIWQFLSPKHPPISSARTPWPEALRLPGSAQVGYLRWLIESRPQLNRIPDQSLLADDRGPGPAHCQATRADDGSYALIYTAAGEPIDIDLTKLAGRWLEAWWFDPRTGTATFLERRERVGRWTFTPPTSGPGRDWVLVLDDLARHYGPPGRR